MKVKATYALITTLFAVTWLLSTRPTEARRMLSEPNDTVETAQAEALAAVQNSSMQITISTVGFDIPPGSEAEQYLKETALIGNGGYFVAAEGGDLAAAMQAAATGQVAVATQGGPVITSPRDGEIAGPATEIIGHTDPEALVVIWTVTFRADTNEELRNVPGIRHRAQENGDFHFRIATPRVAFGQRDLRLRYEIHIRVETPDYKGPETIINMYSK